MSSGPVTNLDFMFCLAKIVGFTAACLGACLVAVGPYVSISYNPVFAQLLVVGVAIFLISAMVESIPKKLGLTNKCQTEPETKIEPVTLEESVTQTVLSSPYRNIVCQYCGKLSTNSTKCDWCGGLPIKLTNNFPESE